jgi:cyclopropane fatty-acyl-phospholipid synthase-like methyltransferase
VPTPDDIVDKMCEMAKVTKDDIIWDLGCGDAVMLVRPIIKYKAKKGVGVDIDPKMIDIAKKYAAEKGVADKVELRVGDILDAKQMPDLKDASVVLLYIGDDLGERLGPVLRANLKPGARVVSHRFSLGDWKETQRETVTGEDGADYELLMWIVGDNEKKKN